MPQFSKASGDRLKTCHKDIQTIFNHVIQYYDCAIVCGYRTKAEQEEAFLKGNSKVHYPATHNSKPSIAVDAAPYEASAIDWGQLQCAHFAGYVKGVADRLYVIGSIKHRIRCGVDWDSDNDINDTSFWDACHFELILSEEERRYLQYSET